jgi:hypothetical protein
MPTALKSNAGGAVDVAPNAGVAVLTLHRGIVRIRLKDMRNKFQGENQCRWK